MQQLRHIAALTGYTTEWTNDTLDIPTSLINIHEQMEIALYAMLEDKGVFADLGGLGRPLKVEEVRPTPAPRPPHRHTPHQCTPFHRTPTPFPTNRPEMFEHMGHIFQPYERVDPATLHPSTSDESVNKYRTPPAHPSDVIQLDLYGNIVDVFGEPVDIEGNLIDPNDFLNALHPQRLEVIEIFNDEDEGVQGTSS